MCYSAQALQNYQLFIREHGAAIDFDEFVNLYEERARLGSSKLRIPKAMDENFADPQNAAERHVQALIKAHARTETARLEADLFAQKKRLANAERSLAKKHTKKAENDQRIANKKLRGFTRKLADLKRDEWTPADARIFPCSYAPILISDKGKLVVRPMRYLCRLAGKPASYDRRYPGTFNARRDNLEGYWKSAFGLTHGLLLATGFYENVSRHRLEGRELREGEQEENVVIEFRPQMLNGPMRVACLWSLWQANAKGKGKAEEPDLMSFAAITDEPPAEVLAAGHDRCIIPLSRDAVDQWLVPEGNLDAAYQALDQRERPYYEHREAA